MFLRALPLVLLAACIGSADTPEPEPATVATEAPTPDGHAVLLISVDGLRWDHLDAVETPNFDRVAAGVKAESLQPPFPSYTFPSHYTLVTGLHPEHHGIISNVFWDPQRKDQFKLGAPEDMADGTWWGGEPVWNTAERQGMKAATMFWPGSEAVIGGVRPTTWMPYQHDLPHTKRVDTVLEWLEQDPADRPGVVTLYFSAVDSAGHHDGPLSDAADQALVDIDAALGRLLDGLESRGLRDDVDIVIVSDHGMAPKDPEKVVFLDEATVNVGALKVVEWSPLFQVHVDPERATEIAADIGSMDHVDCYTRDTTPEDWHYRDHRAIGDVVCLAENGWQLTGRAYYQDNPDRFRGGTHGWNPSWKAMHGVFLADGPRVKDGVKLGTVQAVDVYNTVCALAGLEPAENDGSKKLASQVVEGD